MSEDSKNFRGINIIKRNIGRVLYSFLKLLEEYYQFRMAAYIQCITSITVSTSDFQSEGEVSITS